MPRKKNTVESNAAPECICCSEPLGDSHQLVFDATGIELDLQKLLEQCFELEVEKDEDKVQAVCDECLNELIETYDIQEKEVEEKEQQEAGQAGRSKDSYDDEEDDTTTDLGDGVVFEEADDDYEAEVLEDDFSGSESLGEEFVEEKFDNEDGDDEMKIEGDEQYENVVYLDEADQNFDFKGYKRIALNSNFNEIIFPIDMKCCICSDLLPNHKSVIEHIENVHAIEDFSYPCIGDSTCEPSNDLEDLSYHLVYKHYDLSSITIYNQCSSCLKRFSDFSSFNKHSCYTMKSISRTTTTCEECKQVFRSNKRYRFHLQFHLDSHRPMGCLICDTMFIDENEFFEHVQYGHERDIGLTCIRCDRTFSTEENLTNHKKIHKLTRPYECRMCSKSYLYSQLLKDHVIAHHSKKIPFQCHICEKYLFKQTHLNKHIMQHRMPEEKQVYNCNLCGLIGESEDDTMQHILHDHEDVEASIELITIDRALCCEYCELAFTSPDQLNKHRDLHVIKNFFCNMCPLFYDQYKKLKTHKLTHIDYIDKRKTFPVMRHYMCDVGDCLQTYMQWTSLRSHKRNKHGGQRVIPCYKCPEIFRNPLRFNQHMINVHGGAVHACSSCDKTFTSKMAIAVHVARKHNTTKVPCDGCTNVFSNEFYLKKHKAAVHATYKCELCDRVLKNAKNLHVHHRVVHNKEKRFFCRYCNKGYYNQCDVLEHEETVHEKVKKFKCDLCDYKAVYKQSLTIHMRAHNNETPYKCTLCTKGFRRAYALALHMKRHNNIRNFVCSYEGCGAAYPNQGILNSHLRNKHTNGANVKQRKRRTIAVPQVTPPNNEQRPRRRFDVPVSNIFVDDDDGLDDGVIGEPQNKEIPMETDGSVSYETNDNPDDPVTYIITEVENPAVIVQRNESDHDYIVRPDDNKLYGNVIEEYDILYATTN